MIKARIALLLSVVIWGINFAITKLGLVELEPITLAFIRFLIASIVLLGVIIITKQSAKLISSLRQEPLFFLSLGFIGITLLFILENFSLKFSSTSEVAIVMSGDPILIVVLAFFFLREKLNTQKIIGVAIGFIGVLLVIFNQTDLVSLFKSQSFLGNVLAFVSTLAWATYTIMSKKRIDKYGPVVMLTLAVLFGTFFLFLSMLIFEGMPQLASISVNAWIIVLYLGIVVTSLGFYLWNYALAAFDASKAAVYMFLMPVIAGVLGVLLFKETITPRMVVGALLIFSGIYFTERRGSRKVS